MLLFSRELNVNNAELRATFHGRLMTFRSLLAQEVGAAQKAGGLRDDVAADDVVVLLTSLVQGVAIRWALGARDDRGRVEVTGVLPEGAAIVASPPKGAAEGRRARLGEAP